MYTLTSKVLHALSALLILALLPIGYIMVGLDYYSSWYQVLPNWHYGLGLVFAALLLVRLINKFTLDKLPKQLQWQARLGHGLMYVFMLGAVITGYVLASDDLFFFPSAYDWFAVEQPKWHLAHQIFTYGLLALIVGHVAMALAHQWWKKEAMLARMFR